MTSRLELEAWAAPQEFRAKMQRELGMVRSVNRWDEVSKLGSYAREGDLPDTTDDAD
jgi:hypothetical protein